LETIFREAHISEKGICQELAIAYTPEQNGVIEKRQENNFGKHQMHAHIQKIEH
jgi:hypothetical protein